MTDLLAALLVVAGTVFLVAAAIGVVRFPDFYSRLHAGGKGDTLGQALVLLGLVVLAGVGIVGLKLLVIVFFIFILNPTATHALARGAWVAGLRPWTREAAGRGAATAMTDADREALLDAGLARAQATVAEPPEDAS